MRQRKGVTQSRARLDMRNYISFATMMVHQGHADGMVAGVSVIYPEVLQPALEIIGPRAGGRMVAGMYMLEQKHQLYFLADCVVNINPTAEDLAEIAMMAATQVQNMQMEPRIAMLSFSNFGSLRVPETEKVARAVEILMEQKPDLMADGPIQADVALDPQFLMENYPFTKLTKRPNVLIFPSLEAGNAALKLTRKFSKAHYIGPILIGLAKPIHLVVRGCEVRNIINLTAIASVDAQNND